MTRYLTAAQLRAIHSNLFIDGGREIPPELNDGCVEGTAAQPASGFGGQDQYQTIAQKAAAYAMLAAMKHCFEDGNKRLAAVAMVVFLGMNGFAFNDTVRTPRLANAILDLVTKKCTFDAFARWVQRRITPISTAA